jgi:hypothetical protein
VDDPRLRTLRPPGLEVRRVVGRPDLPHLLRPRHACPWLLLGRRLCERCTLADTLGRLLNDGTGHVASALQPLVTALLEMDRPKSRLIWLRNPNVVRLLRGLATGDIPLTHDGLHQETSC